MKRSWPALVCIAMFPLLYSGHDKPTLLQQIQQRGSMTLLTRNGASSYYLGPEGPTGPEYELVQQFSRFLDVALEVREADSLDHLAELLDGRQGDLIAANMTRTQAREKAFRFGPDYLETQVLAISRLDGPHVTNLAGLVGLKIEVVAGSGYEEVLNSARREYPQLEWVVRDDLGIDDLLMAVSEGEVDVTLVDSSIFAINRPFYPNLVATFTAQEMVPHAWAFRLGRDESLIEQSRIFMQQVQSNGRLADLLERFTPPEEHLDQEGMYKFLERLRASLPPLIEVFREAGDAHDIDWRLLAAVGYQESHWDPAATSVTGVRGIMMLTEQTALQLGVEDRLDPGQSIDGGARYIVRLRNRLPARIPEPDRTWMALAAYNLGMAHLRDVRILTEKQGLDPDRWTDVSLSLGLLSQEKWYTQTRNGYARGLEARKFVDNVRRYFEILSWMDTRDHPLLVAEAGHLQ